jgi:ABC-type dipeptide/oligopeptide/nickel transport system ATPase component
VIEVKNLKVSFQIENQIIEALKGVSFSLNKGEIVAIVGESGSGKSVTCQAIMDILPKYAKKEGKIIIDNKDLDSLSNEEKRQLRGNKISMVFQESSAVLNPLVTIGEQIVETILAHKNVSKNEAKELALNAMEKVKIPNPKQRFNQYPHELSGGLKQRAVIAIAVVNNPDYLLADEPTTALDVTISLQILNLFNELKEDLNMGILLITHDLGVVAQVADRALVMYKGELLEEGKVFEVFDNPQHPYTKKLLSSRIFLTGL